jgi:hypothetical protein
MLDHTGRDDRQLFDLMTRRLAHTTKLPHREDVTTAAPCWPVLDDLIDRREWQQLPAVTLMPRLRTRPAPRRILAPLRRRPGRVRTRRTRRITRATTQLALKPLHPPLQLLDTTIHRQQHLNYSLTPHVIDRLRLRALHTPRFDEAELCPPTN